MRENIIKWRDHERSYQADLRKMNREVEDMRSKLTEAHGESSSIKEEIKEL